MYLNLNHEILQNNKPNILLWGYLDSSMVDRTFADIKIRYFIKDNYIYIYVYMCVCVCIYIYISVGENGHEGLV